MLFKIKFANGTTKQRIIQPVIKELLDLVLDGFAVSSVDEVKVFYVDSSNDTIAIADQPDLDACIEDFRITNGLPDTKNLRISLRAALKNTEPKHEIFSLVSDSIIRFPSNTTPLSSGFQNMSTPPELPNPTETSKFDQSRMLVGLQSPSVMGGAPPAPASSVRGSIDQSGIQRSLSQSQVKKPIGNGLMGHKSTTSVADRNSPLPSPLGRTSWFTSSTTSILPGVSIHRGKDSPPPNSSVSDFGNQSHKYAENCRAYRNEYLANKWKQREVWDRLDLLLQQNKGLRMSIDLYKIVYDQYWNDYIKNKEPKNPAVIQTLYQALEVDDIFHQNIKNMRSAAGLPPA